MTATDDKSTRAAALLLIHGIGEQDPYEALDAFTRGLASRLGVGPGEMEHRLIWRGERAESLVRVPLRQPLGRTGATVLDIHEFYWAGLVQGRIRLREVLAWVARTSLTPLRSWSQQPAVLFGERGAARRRLWVFVREFARAGGLLAAAAAIVLPFVYAAYEAAVVARAGRNLWATVSAVGHPIALAAWGSLVFFALMLFTEWRRLLPRRLYQSPMEQSANLWWRRASVAALIVLGLAAWAVHEAYGLDVPALVRRLGAAIRPWPVLAPLAAAVLAVFLKRPLVKFVGDIVLYVTADEKSEFFRTRAEILQASTQRLRTLLLDPQYDSVYIAGHSLGSVIAYDTINYVIREMRAEPVGPGKLSPDDVHRLRGLLTFGSPLDKVYYFFRIEVADAQAVRAQLLSSLHGFRRRSSSRDYGAFKLARYTIPSPLEFQWLNVYSTADFISGYLDFYRVDRQVQRSYWNPLTAHTAYWDDPVFYREVETWL